MFLPTISAGEIGLMIVMVACTLAIILVNELS